MERTRVRPRPRKAWIFSPVDGDAGALGGVEDVGHVDEQGHARLDADLAGGAGRALAADEGAQEGGLLLEQLGLTLDEGDEAGLGGEVGLGLGGGGGGGGGLGGALARRGALAGGLGRGLGARGRRGGGGVGLGVGRGGAGASATAAGSATAAAGRGLGGAVGGIGVRGAGAWGPGAAATAVGRGLGGVAAGRAGSSRRRAARA